MGNTVFHCLSHIFSIFLHMKSRDIICGDIAVHHNLMYLYFLICIYKIALVSVETLTLCLRFFSTYLVSFDSRDWHRADLIIIPTVRGGNRLEKLEAYLRELRTSDFTLQTPLSRLGEGSVTSSGRNKPLSIFLRRTSWGPGFVHTRSSSICPQGPGQKVWWLRKIWS